MQITRKALISLTAATVILSAPTAMAQNIIAQGAMTPGAMTPGAMTQSAGEVLGPAAVAPLKEEQPAAKIIVDPPLAEPLSHGLVFIQYRTENLRIVPVFGPNALDVSPRIGHIHVVVDDAPWHWADASGEPLILVGLPAGPHKVEIILANANHQAPDKAVVAFVVPKADASDSHH